MTEDMQSLPRCYGVLARTASLESSLESSLDSIGEPRATNTDRAWDSLAMLLVCIVFWTIVVTLALF